MTTSLTTLRARIERLHAAKTQRKQQAAERVAAMSATERLARITSMATRAEHDLAAKRGPHYADRRVLELLNKAKVRAVEAARRDNSDLA